MTTEPPPIPKKYTRTSTVRFWGADYQVTPAVAQEHLGNGRLLLGFQPLNTRPDYYLIRVDSSFFRDDKDWDRIEEVIEVLEDEFSEKERERENLIEDLEASGIEPTSENTDLAGNEDRLEWPALSLDSGYHWWQEAWLRRPRLVKVEKA